MVFGIVVSTMLVVVGGLVIFALLIAQMLVGTRKIHFKGRTHQLVHRRLAWTLFGIATVHGLLGVVYGFQLRIG